MKALTGRPRPARSAATIYEVAQRAGVSIATVSRVQRQAEQVAPATRERVLRAIAQLAYRPSPIGRSLARGRHDAIGFVFPDLSGPYYSAVILGYEQASADDRSATIILATRRRHAAAAEVRELADRTDGLVITGSTVDDAIVEELRWRGVPVLLIARPPVADADTVRAENVAQARALTAHLIEHGYRRIAFVGDPSTSPDVRERWTGHTLALREAGLGPARSPVRCAFREEDGARAFAELASARLPDAIVAANDELAMGFLGAARDAGVRVPDDVALTGWDDIAVARHLHPALTTVRQPMRELGRRAAELLRERISAHRAAPRHEVLPSELVVRSSCGCPSSRSEGERVR